jgi:hypothetical protein
MHVSPAATLSEGGKKRSRKVAELNCARAAASRSRSVSECRRWSGEVAGPCTAALVAAGLVSKGAGGARERDDGDGCDGPPSENPAFVPVVPPKLAPGARARPVVDIANRPSNCGTTDDIAFPSICAQTAQRMPMTNTIRNT